MGTLFHEAMACYWHEQNLDEVAVQIDMSTEPEQGSPVMRAVSKVTLQEGDALREQGVIGVEVNLDGDDEEAARHGRYPGTCDLITDNGNGLTVTDYKTKAKLEAKYADAELRQTQRSWQLYQYAWFVQQKYGRPVTSIRKLLVAFTPVLKVWLVAYPITQQQLQEWYAQAWHVWIDMDWTENADKWQVAQNEQSCERYGWNWRCEMYSHCWEGGET